MDWKDTAKQIVAQVGGKENIQGATYCTTRLRLTLSDESKANDEAVSSIPGVIGVAHGSGQYQIITANIVANAIISLSTAVPGLLAAGGHFIASGIIDTRADEVEAALKAAGLAVAERKEKRGWVCFVCTAA